MILHRRISRQSQVKSHRSWSRKWKRIKGSQDECALVQTTADVKHVGGVGTNSQKRKERNKMVKNKARLVEQGFSQDVGPACLRRIHVAFWHEPYMSCSSGVVVVDNVMSGQMDVNTAFLNSDVEKQHRMATHVVWIEVEQHT